MSSMNGAVKNGRKYTRFLLTALCVLFFAWVSYRSFYDLFVFKPGIHYPRVALSDNVWGQTAVNFTVNVPTTTGFIILGTAVLGLLVSILLFVAISRGKGRNVRVYWLILAIAFVVSVMAYIVQVLDVFANAFEGVG